MDQQSMRIIVQESDEGDCCHSVSTETRTSLQVSDSDLCDRVQSGVSYEPKEENKDTTGGYEVTLIMNKETTIDRTTGGTDSSDSSLGKLHPTNVQAPNAHMLIHKCEKPCKCDLCNHVDTQSQQLIHTVEKSYKCDRCNYSSSKSYNVKRHKLIHTGEKPYKCDVCDFCTTRSASLHGHKMMHRGNQQQKCDKCDYSSINPRDLKRHSTIHTGENPSKCDSNDNSTTQPDSLLPLKGKHRHYKCDICYYSTSQINYLLKHNKEHIRTMKKQK